MNRQLITHNQAKSRKTQHTSPCSDCPWARKSLAGWLGNQTAEQWIQIAHSEAVVECHTTDKLCAGAAIYRANVCKEPRDPKAFRLGKDKVKVFGWLTEFLNHHNKVNRV